MTSAPAKIILFGEHAVVYGQPAIAAPLSNLRVTATIRKLKDQQQMRLITTGENESLPIDIHLEDVNSAFATTARLVLDYFDALPPQVEISIDSQIPVASGLGSGAAVTTALARAIAEAINQSLPDEKLNQIVFEVEKIYHGTPSGIDNTVIVYEKPVYYVRNHPLELLSIPKPIMFVVGDTGISASTKIAVSDVGRLHKAEPNRIQPILASIGGLVNRARIAIESGHIEPLGHLMLQNHALLRTLTVSSPEIENLIEAAIADGALGAKLSGGGRGGNMIALVQADTAENVRQALLNAGAKRAFITTLGE